MKLILITAILCLPTIASMSNKISIKIVHTSLLDLRKQYPDVTAIVNAANVYMRGGGGLDGAIHAAAGPELLAELKQLVPDRTKTAQVVVTKGYKTGFEHILHVAGPIYSSKKSEECRQLLHETYKNVVREAESLKRISTLGLASISTGIYGYPLKEAADLAIETVTTELKATINLKTVIFAMFGNEEFQVFKNAFERWKIKTHTDL